MFSAHSYHEEYAFGAVCIDIYHLVVSEFPYLPEGDASYYTYDFISNRLLE